jgi:hypothetical protein
MVQELQSQEQNSLDIVRRRAMALQQKMLNQPVERLKTIFDQFQKALEIEDEAYSEQREFGKKQEVSLSKDELAF